MKSPVEGLQEVKECLWRGVEGLFISVSVLVFGLDKAVLVSCGEDL